MPDLFGLVVPGMAVRGSGIARRCQRPGVSLERMGSSVAADAWCKRCLLHAAWEEGAGVVSSIESRAVQRCIAGGVEGLVALAAAVRWPGAWSWMLGPRWRLPCSWSWSGQRRR
eukprot:951164-Alexandrium_andersonii.AAC.1